MKVAIPIEKDSTWSKISQRFARSPFFAIVDTKKQSVEYIRNPYLQDVQGTGIHIAELLFFENKVKAIITYDIGLHIQQITNEKKVQLILIQSRIKKLDRILKLMKFKIYH